MVEHSTLGKDQQTCRVINGGWQLSAGHRKDPDDRAAVVTGLVRMAQAGLTTFDCADIYTGVEELFGEVRAAYLAEGGSRDDLQLHTKLVPDRAALGSVDRSYVNWIVDRSLQRLGVDRLDLVQFHWWDYDTPGCVDAAGYLGDLQDAGKIRSIGVTNFNSAELETLFAAGIPIVSAQVQYSLLDRRPERRLAALCRSHGAKLLCYGSLAGGFLTGRYVGAPAPEDMENRSLVKYRLIIDEYGGWEAYQQLLRYAEAIAASRGVPVSAVAARYVLQKSGVAAVIIGARGDTYLNQILSIFDFVLDDAEMARLDNGSEIRVPGDCFDLERVPGGPHQRIMKMNLNDA